VIYILLPPIVIRQTRRGEAPELSVMIWMGCLGLNLPVGDPAVFVENLNLMLTI